MMPERREDCPFRKLDELAKQPNANLREIMGLIAALGSSDVASFVNPGSPDNLLECKVCGAAFFTHEVPECDD